MAEIKMTPQFGAKVDVYCTCGKPMALTPIVDDAGDKDLYELLVLDNIPKLSPVSATYRNGTYQAVCNTCGKTATVYPRITIQGDEK